MKVREIKKEDIKTGSVIYLYDDNGVYDVRNNGYIVKNIVDDYVVIKGSDSLSRTFTIDSILSFFRVEDKPTGIPTFSGQIGGKHYNKNDPIQFARDNYPAEQLEGFFRINVDKYVARYDKKNGIEDLKKARHYLDLLIELKEKRDAE